jgi:CTP synthase
MQNIDCNSLYEVPLLLEKENFAQVACKKLNLPEKNPDLSAWISYVEKEKKLSQEINIAIIGKYVKLHDAYLSIIESLKHAGVYNNIKININWIDAQDFEDEKKSFSEILKNISGVIVPGGFGIRAVEGKIKAIRFVRENKIAFLGICLGMQCALIEFARDVAGIRDANTTEVSQKNVSPVVDIMPDQKNLDTKGGTMRLGKYPCKISKNSIAYKAYGEELIYERHRHRFEFNNFYRDKLIQAGLNISGVSPNNKLVEIIELPEEIHPWFVGVQFHPEFKSRPNRPHPLFIDFINNIKIKNKL